MIDEGPAGTVDSAALTAAGITVTVAVCVTAPPSMVAETVLLSATVELRLPVATPLAFVGPNGCVTVLPLPVADKMTVAPATGLPLASLAVTVIAEMLVPAIIEVGAAAIVDWPARTAPAVTVTAAVWAIATYLMVAGTLLLSATVAPSAAVPTPQGFVVPTG